MRGSGFSRSVLCSALVLICSLLSAVILAADPGTNREESMEKAPEEQDAPDISLLLEHHIAPELQASDVLSNLLVSLKMSAKELAQCLEDGLEDRLRDMRASDLGVERQGPVLQLPREINFAIARYLLSAGYSSALQNYARMDEHCWTIIERVLRRNPWLQMGEMLGVLGQDLDDDFVDGLMYIFADDAVAKVEQAGQEMGLADQVELLREVVHLDVKVAKMKSQRAVEAYCRALVADKRLGAEIWVKYVKAFISNALPLVAPNKACEEVLMAHLRAGSVEVTNEIVGRDFGLRISRLCSYNINSIVFKAAPTYSGFWQGVQSGDCVAMKDNFEVIRRNPDMYGKVDLFSALKLTSRKGHKKAFALLLEWTGTGRELYKDIDSVDFNDEMSKWASLE